MKRNLIAGFVSLLAIALHAEDSARDELTKAAQALGGKENYSWTTTTEVPDSVQFKPGPQDGKTEKGGATHLTLTFGDNTTHIVVKGDKGAATNQDGDWQTAAELEDSEGPGRFMAGFIRNLRTPADQAAELAKLTKEVKKADGVYSGELTEEGAQTFTRFGRRAGGQPTKDAKGSVKFWVKDGVLTKYEYKVSGMREFNGNEFPADRTVTVEIKNVGTTKVEVPEAAKKKIS